MNRIEKIPYKIADAIIWGVFIVMFFGASVNVHYGLDNLEMVKAFETDEGHGAERTLQNVLNRDFDPRGYFHYPYLWFSIAIAFLRFFQRVGFNIDIRYIVATYREISIIGCVLSVYFLFKLLRSFGASSTLSLLAGLFLVTVPDYYYWTHMLHPDVPQAALILASFYMAFRSLKLKGMVQSAVTNSAAAAFKFGGLFTFPFTVLYHSVAQLIGAGEAGRPISVKRLIPKLGLCLFVFVAFYLLVNPYAAKNLKQAYEGVRYIQTTIGGAQEGAATPPRNPWLWVNTFYLLMGKYNLFIILSGLAGVLVFFVESLMRKRRSRSGFGIDLELLKVFTVLLYVVTCTVVLTKTVSWDNLRYGYHIMVMLIFLGFFGIHWLTDKIPAQVKGWALLLLTLLLVGRVQGAFDAVQFASHKPKSSVVRLAEFVNEKYPSDISIFHETGVYMPPRYKNAYIGWGVTMDDVKNRPRLIILCAYMSGRWMWKQDGTRFEERKWTRQPDLASRGGETYRVFEHLTDPKSQWKMVYEQDQFVVFENMKPKPR